VPHTVWTEYQVAFASATQSKFSTLHATGTSSAFVTAFLAYNNYPCFYDSSHPTGFSKSGRYTCYRRQQNFTAWSYFAGASNPGVVAEVLTRPYSIGYSVLEIALSQRLPTAGMINKAGVTVVANHKSVAFAVMDLAGTLNSLFQESISDGSAFNVWPISGFSYFVIRKNSHVAAGNCERRSAAMEYLYNFYSSKTVSTAAQKLGFAALPEFIATIVVDYLLENAKCDNGQYALAKHRITPSPILGATSFVRVINEYLTAYTAVDPSAQWGFQYDDDSSR
jgi:ABC-type phosphate transport system substrate-binding protein